MSLGCVINKTNRSLKIPDMIFQIGEQYIDCRRYNGWLNIEN